jgi:hypothetical protein
MNHTMSLDAIDIDDEVLVDGFLVVSLCSNDVVHTSSDSSPAFEAVIVLRWSVGLQEDGNSG